MSLFMRYAARSDVGLLRDGNEDSAFAGPRLLVVADGMGGAAAGEVASSVAVAALVHLDEDLPGSQLLDTLGGAVEQANDQVRAIVRDHPRLDGMGTTLTALLWAGTRMGLVHVGDSRAYLLRGGSLQQITQDHTYVQSLVDEGRITEDEAGHHPQRNLILRVLDGREPLELDLSVRESRVGDRYLLCSDGLTGVVSAQTIADALGQGDPAEAAEALVQLALRAGAPDNVTCVVAEVADGDEPVDQHPLVVGAVAEDDSGAKPARSTAAVRAAAALRTGTYRRGAHAPRGSRAVAREPSRSWRRRWLPRLGLLAFTLAVVLGGGFSAYAWSRTQYYVGADAGSVAVFRGLQQQVAGSQLSRVYEREPTILADLPTFERERVETGIEARNLGDAHTIVGRLGSQARLCVAARAQARAWAAQQSGKQAASSSGPTPSAHPTRTASPVPGAVAADPACGGSAQ